MSAVPSSSDAPRTPAVTTTSSLDVTDAAAAAGHVVEQLRARRPLVQCITNYVSMDLAANLLNAAGASPAMVHHPQEAGEFAGLADAVVANIGTPSPDWADGIVAATTVAVERGVPWVLDPVAVGATSYRRDLAGRLLTNRPTVIRGNAGEVLALAGVAGASRGVDSAADSSAVGDQAAALAAEAGCVVAVTGARDLVTDGRRQLTIDGGDRRAPMITALGCSATALVAACCAVGEDRLAATAAALAMITVAIERAGRDAAGPGSLRWRLLDELADLSADQVGSRIEESHRDDQS
ncbi:hydroxyethylthiazole kinase [Microlunatus soli]|uniref:Hydroxyethylthiazole kinase n=1 Tax=Microlunatus soli TaxID=630515 RepID=A0A1H1NNB6_9ACTN|nr:hydroxyethylthiazole kinase [Microlunatus soli]SDS00484.1 hydroxyethylthiazole kinase [Microlunatus soli]